MAKVRWRLLVPVVVLVVAVGATVVVLGARARPVPVVTPQADPRARAYLTEVLDLLENRSLNKHRVDWPDVRRRALAELGQAQTTADTYPAIALALRALGDEHTFFVRPEEATAFTEDPLVGDPTAPLGPEQAHVPSGQLVDGDIGHLTLPGNVGSLAGYARTGGDTVRRLDRSRPCGWVVDLRGNTGGAVYPMLDAVAPLLGDGLLGAFVDADGHQRNWLLDRGRITIGGDVVPRDLPGDPAIHDYTTHNDYVLSRSNPPVAVLTDAQTASAGEATLIAFRGRAQTRSFGDHTAGFATGNVTHPLSDGAVLVLTESADLDRTGHRYDNTPIPPDQQVARVDGRDAVLEAATAWLREQPGCPS